MVFSQKEIKGKLKLIDHNSFKVIFVGCIAILITLLVMNITSIVIMNNAAVDKLKRYDLQMQANMIGGAIEQKIDRAMDVSRILSQDPLVRKWLREGEPENSDKTHVAQQMKYISGIFGGSQDKVFLVSDLTAHYWVYHEDTMQQLDDVSEDNVSDQWYFLFRRNRNFPEQNSYQMNVEFNKNLRDMFVWINVPVQDSQGFLGAAGLGINLKQLVGELWQNDVDSHIKSDIWLIDKNGTICISKNQEELGQPARFFIADTAMDKIAEDVREEKNFSTQEYQDENGILYDIAYKKIKDTEWKLVIRIPREESVHFLGEIKRNMILSGIVILLFMLLIFYFLARQIANPYKRSLELNQQLEDAVRERTWELQEKNRKIRDSMEYAQLIQQTILPLDEDFQKAFSDHFILFEPRDIVGGDFYWLRGYDSGTLLIVGDCTGHGVPGALMSTAVTAMLSHIADEISHTDPAKMLTELDDMFKKSFFRTPVDEHFISVGLEAAVIFIDRQNTLFFAGANMSLYRFDGTEVLEIKGDKRSVQGNEGNQRPFTRQSIKSGEQDRFYLATDGCRDQPGGEKKLPYGRKKLMQLLQKTAELPMAEQKKEIMQALADHAAGERRRDDLTLLGFRLQNFDK